MSFDLKFYLSLFVRRLHYFLVVAVAVATFGVTVALILPAVYLAQARLLVEAAQIPGDLAASTVLTAATEQLQIIQQRLTTRAALLDVANRLQIYAGRPEMSADAIVDDMRARLKMLTGAGSGTGAAKGNARTIIVTISFEDGKAVRAAAVANEFVTMLLQENVSLRTESAGQTLEFFKQEVARLDTELAQRSAAILEFKTRNKDALPDSLDYRRTRQAQQQEQLLQYQREEAALNDRRARLVDLYERTGQVDTPAQNKTPEELQLQKLKDELSSALVIYSPQNPKVRVLQAQVSALEKAVTAQLAAATPDGESLSPYELQLADIDGQIKYIADQRKAVQAELDALRVTIDATPKNAIDLDVLERDYAGVQAQYAQASSRLALAETGDRIEALSKGQRISVLEQATVPRSPERPNRILIAGGGVAAGIGLGFGLVLLLEGMNRSIRRPVQLTTTLGITPFATLPYMRTRRQTRLRRVVIGLALFIVMVGIPLGLFLLHTFYLPMDLLIDRVVQRLGLDTLLAQLRQGLGQ